MKNSKNIICIHQYIMTFKYLYIIMLLAPVIILLGYYMNSIRDWSITGYLINIGSTYLLFASVLFIISRKKIIFSDSQIQITRYGKIKNTVLWSNIQNISVSHGLVTKYEIECLNLIISFESTKKIFNKIYELCSNENARRIMKKTMNG